MVCGYLGEYKTACAAAQLHPISSCLGHARFRRHGIQGMKLLGQKCQVPIGGGRNAGPARAMLQV
jgi:hypothetical protein